MTHNPALETILNGKEEIINIKKTFSILQKR